MATYIEIDIEDYMDEIPDDFLTEELKNRFKKKEDRIELITSFFEISIIQKSKLEEFLKELI